MKKDKPKVVIFCYIKKKSQNKAFRLAFKTKLAYYNIFFKKLIN